MYDALIYVCEQSPRPVIGSNLTWLWSSKEITTINIMYITHIYICIPMYMYIGIHVHVYWYRCTCTCILVYMYMYMYIDIINLQGRIVLNLFLLLFSPFLAVSLVRWVWLFRLWKEITVVIHCLLFNRIYLKLFFKATPI